MCWCPFRPLLPRKLFKLAWAQIFWGFGSGTVWLMNRPQTDFSGLCSSLDCMALDPVDVLRSSGSSSKMSQPRDGNPAPREKTKVKSSGLVAAMLSWGWTTLEEVPVLCWPLDGHQHIRVTAQKLAAALKGTATFTNQLIIPCLWWLLLQCWLPRVGAVKCLEGTQQESCKSI